MEKLENLPRESFFQKEHFETFLPSKFERNDKEILQERKDVQLRLLELHDELYPEIKKKKWNIDKHNSEEHLVSGIDISNPFIANKLSSIWLHYGKTDKEIKGYQKLVDEKSKESFINHIRLQVIISNQRREKKYVVGFWLVIGKNDGSVWDRDSINKKLKSDSVFTERFFELVTSLGDNYFVEVNNEVQDNKSFESVEDFKSFILKDNRRNYFIIGKDYAPNAKEVFEENIVNTALEEFSRLYPIYELVKHRLS